MRRGRGLARRNRMHVHRLRNQQCQHLTNSIGSVIMSLYLWYGKLLIRTMAGVTGLATSAACCCGGDEVVCDDIPATLHIDMDDETDCSSCFSTTQTLTLNEQVDCTPTILRCWFGQGAIGCSQYMTIRFVCHNDGTITVSISCGGVTSTEVDMSLESVSPWRTSPVTVALPGSSCCGQSVNAEISVVIYE